MSNIKIIKCNSHECDNQGSVTLDLDATNLTCGIRGIVDISNARLSGNKVICSTCDQIMHEDGKE